MKVEIEFDTKRNPLSAGFRIAWVSGEDAESEIDLSCGAGVGSPFMVFSRKDKKTGKVRYAVADVRPLMNELAEKLKEIEL